MLSIINEYQLFNVKILEALIENNNISTLIKKANVKNMDSFCNLPLEVQGNAYLKFIQDGGIRVELNETYNQMVIKMEHDILCRRFEYDDVVVNLNGKYFKSMEEAKNFQSAFKLDSSHEALNDTEKGFYLSRLSLAKKSELNNKKLGIKTYIEIRDEVLTSMGINCNGNEDGEITATDDEWDVIDARIEAIQQKQHTLLNN